MSANMKFGSVPGVKKPISRLVQGVIQIDTKDEDHGFEQLDAVWEAGITAIDTAHIYGGGAHDRIIGKWMAARGTRDKMVVIAKGAHHNGDRRRVTPYDILADMHDTLARMKTDYIDLYILHRDDPDYPVEPIIDVLNQAVNEGKIHAFGGSNWSVERLEAANKYAEANGKIPFAVSSPNFSLAEQVEEPWENCVSISGPEGEAARKWYAEKKMPLFTWSSMAGGFWSGRFERDNLESLNENYFDKLVLQCYAYPQNFDRLDRVKELAKEKGLSVPQIALAYVLHYPMDIYALVGSSNKAEVAANVAALNAPLTEQEMAYLDLRADSPK